jgi:hypothetical protein
MSRRKPPQGTQSLEFGGVEPAATGRPLGHPVVPLNLYIYGYLNRVQSNCRQERGVLRKSSAMCSPAARKER